MCRHSAPDTPHSGAALQKTALSQAFPCAASPCAANLQIRRYSRQGKRRDPLKNERSDDLMPMLSASPGVILITGIMASGKSTVAQLLAERFEKSVHLRGDLFRRMVVNNRKEVTPDAGSDELEQLRLRYRLTAHAADAYCQAGFTVVAQDVVVGPMLIDFISYVQSRPLYVVVLCPSPSVVALREASRAKKGYGAWTVEGLDRLLRHETPRIGMWLDSSELTAEETVNEIVARFQGEALLT
jgi:chloramphenicol 3-O-phosphotransferase